MTRRSKFGWVELVLGTLLIILGIFTLANPNTALTTFVYIYGFFAIISGIADITLYIKLQKRYGLGPVAALISGILSAIVGIIILFNPFTMKIVLAVLFPIWFIIHCVSRLGNLNFTRVVAGNAQYWISLILNVLGLVLGILLMVNPFVSLTTLVYIAAFYLLLSGISSLALGLSKFGA